MDIEDIYTCQACDEDVDTTEWEAAGGCPFCGHGRAAEPVQRPFVPSGSRETW